MSSGAINTGSLPATSMECSAREWRRSPMGGSVGLGRLRARRGLSLVELMIAMVLGLLILGGVLQVFSSMRQSYQMQEALSRIQENGRYALERISRDIRMAGHWGWCRVNLEPELPRPNASNNNDPAWLLQPRLIRNTLDPPPPANPAFAHDFAVALMGHEAVGTAWQPALPSSSITPLQGTDAIVLGSINGPGITVTAHPGNPSSPGSADLQVDTDDLDAALAATGFRIDPGDILMVTDCESAAVFQATAGNIMVSGTITHNTGSAFAPGNYTQLLGRSFVGANIYRLSRIAYFVADSNPDPSIEEPALFSFDTNRNPSEIALIDGAVDMQIEFGEDTDGNGLIDEFRTANDVTDWQSVLAVRVELLLRSQNHVLQEPVQNLAFNGGLFSANTGDRRMYQVFSKTIGVRNRLP